MLTQKTLLQKNNTVNTDNIAISSLNFTDNSIEKNKERPHKKIIKMNIHDIFAKLWKEKWMELVAKHLLIEVNNLREKHNKEILKLKIAELKEEVNKRVKKYRNLMIVNNKKNYIKRLKATKKRKLEYYQKKYPSNSSKIKWYKKKLTEQLQQKLKNYKPKFNTKKLQGYKKIISKWSENQLKLFKEKNILSPLKLSINLSKFSQRIADDSVLWKHATIYAHYYSGENLNDRIDKWAKECKNRGEKKAMKQYESLHFITIWENIVRYTETIDNAMKARIWSEPHRENMLDKERKTFATWYAEVEVKTDVNWKQYTKVNWGREYTWVTKKNYSWEEKIILESRRFQHFLAADPD